MQNAFYAIRINCTWCILLCVFCSCSRQPDNSGFERTQAFEETRKLLDAHIDANHRSDANAASAVYSNDIKFFGENGGADTSRSQVIKGYQDANENFELIDLAYTPEEFEVFGDKAYELGTYLLKLKPKNAKTDSLITSTSRYLIIWQFDDKEGWKIKRGLQVGIANK